MLKKNKKEIWVTNINTKKDLRIEDLQLIVRAGKSINLLSKNCRFTDKQIRDSIESGSIFKKSKWLRVREGLSKFKLTDNEKIIPVTERTTSPVRYSLIRTSVKIEKQTYEDLDGIDNDSIDEQFADELSEIAAMETAPALSVDRDK